MSMAIVAHAGAGHHAPKNTISAFLKAIELGCQRTEMDVMLAKDGSVVVAHDEPQEPGGFPRLQEVIDVCKGRIGLQIELKAKGTPKPVNDLIVRNGIASDVLVTSFEAELLREIKAINPELKVGLLFKEQPSDLWDVARGIPLDYVCPRSTAVTEEMVGEAHALGAKVYAYRVNDRETGERLLKMGVDDLGTDFPELFL